MDFDVQITNGDVVIKTIYERILEAIMPRLLKIAEETVDEGFAHMDAELQDKFRNLMQESFYDQYSPEFYVNRNFSLKELLDITLDDNGFVFEFDSSRITPMRGGGDGLYEQVFVQGYHGGARAPDGVMRYRTPYPIYVHWGRAASRSSSPRDAADKLIDDYFERVFKPGLQALFEQKLSQSDLLNISI